MLEMLTSSKVRSMILYTIMFSVYNTYGYIGLVSRATELSMQTAVEELKTVLQKERLENIRIH